MIKNNFIVTNDFVKKRFIWYIGTKVNIQDKNV